MSPESLDYYRVAERILAQAESLLADGYTEVAAREAYMAALNTARAIVFEITGEAPKTHSGTRKVLSKLVHDGLPLDNAYTRFLATGFDQKTDADYGPRSPVQQEAAESSVETARRFLAAARELLDK